MIEYLRIVAEFVGWGVLLLCAWYVLLVLWYQLRWVLVARMVDTARGFMAGGVQAGMYRWVDVGEMVLPGESGMLSYAPKATGSQAAEMDGPAIQLLGIAGQDRMVGVATVFWCEGPPVNQPYAKMVFRRGSVIRRKFILPFGYSYGFKVGSEMATKALQSLKPDDRQKWWTP